MVRTVVTPQPKPENLPSPSTLKEKIRTRTPSDKDREREASGNLPWTHPSTKGMTSRLQQPDALVATLLDMYASGALVDLCHGSNDAFCQPPDKVMTSFDVLLMGRGDVGALVTDQIPICDVDCVQLPLFHAFCAID